MARAKRGTKVAFCRGVKLSAIALDYDGTIARDDILETPVRQAIAAVRRRGQTVLLVTGRILEDLRRVAGDLHLVDTVVAENGAVVHFPGKGRTLVLAPTTPPAFLFELERRGIPHRAGQCLVDADAAEAPRLLEVIRSLELPLVLLFNGGRVMVLPQGVSKASGLQSALDALRLSPRNTLAIGDAENDHEMLRLAEVGVAVAWGSPILRAAADIVLAGSEPIAIASYLRQLSDSGELPVPTHARRRLLLGHTDDGREFSLAVRGRNVLVTGDPKSGKSWIAGLLCEQLILHGYCVCVIDPEGDYRSLEALPGITVMGGDALPPTPAELAVALRYPDRSIVIDLSKRSHEEKGVYVRTILPALNALRRERGLPHRILIDEAHYYLHDEAALQLLDLEYNGYTVVTYCASRLPAALLEATEVMIVTAESSPAEIDALFDRCRGCAPSGRAQWSRLTSLTVGRAVALPVTEEAGGSLREFTIAPRFTTHVRHCQKYVDVAVGRQRAFVFRDGGHERHVETLRTFVALLPELSPRELAPYASRGDFSRWIENVFGDRALALEIRQLERKAHDGGGLNLSHEIAAAVRARYELRDNEGATLKDGG